MIDTLRWALRPAAGAMLILAATTTIVAGPRYSVPRSGGGAPRASMPSRGSMPSRAAMRSAPAPRGTAAPHGQVPARGTANGTATWGYGGYNGYGGYGGYGGYYGGYGYGCYPYWGYPYWGWSVGLYGGWGWPYYGSYYGPYYGGGYYPPYYDGEGYAAHFAPDPNTPAVAVTRLAPSKAEILLDGVSVGYAKDYDGRWDSLTIPPGRHTLTFRAEGYTTRVVEVDARPGASLLFQDDLKRGEGEERQALPPPAEEPRAAPAPAAASVAQGRLKVHVQPDDAAVYLDGEYLGVAGELARLHGSIPVATGRHQLEVVRPGFATSVTSVYVTGEDIADARVSLVAAP